MRVAETQVGRNTWGSGVSGRAEITLDSKHPVGKFFDVSEWHYISNKKQIGPVSLEELINKKNSGEIAPTDLVWSAGMAAWLPIQEAQQSVTSLSKHESDSPSSHPARGYHLESSYRLFE